MELTQAQSDWLFTFRDKVSDVETTFTYAANAHHDRRTNRLAEEQNRLDAEATLKSNKHSEALRTLTEWVTTHPYPVADQTAPTVADNLQTANMLANLADDKQQYRNGWNDSMCAVEDVRKQRTGPNQWARRVCNSIKEGELKDAYNRGCADALTHFLQTGQTDRHAP